MAAEQKQIVELFYPVDEPLKESLQRYLNENPGLRVASMVASANLDRLLVVLEPVVDDSPPELIFPPPQPSRFTIP